MILRKQASLAVSVVCNLRRAQPGGVGNENAIGSQIVVSAMPHHAPFRRRSSGFSCTCARHSD